MFEDERGLAMHRWFGESQAVAAFNFGEAAASLAVPAPCGLWRRAAGSDPTAPDTISTEGRLDLALAPESFVLYLREDGR